MVTSTSLWAGLLPSTGDHNSEPNAVAAEKMSEILEHSCCIQIFLVWREVGYWTYLQTTDSKVSTRRIE